MDIVFRRATLPEPISKGKLRFMSARTRFFSYVVKQRGCWGWNGHKDKDGYGRLKDNGKVIAAHRYSYIINYGPIPDGMVVCHACDNPECANPNHLFIGTTGDNNADRHAKGRTAARERNGMAKLKPHQVDAIRAKYRGDRHGEIAAIARDYGVTWSLVKKIVTNQLWKEQGNEFSD